MFAEVHVHARTNAMEHVFVQGGSELMTAVEAEKTSADTSKLDLAVSVPETICVNKQPIVPPALPVSAVVGLMLSNSSGETQQLYAPTPCDIFNWWSDDGAENVVHREPPVVCSQIPQTSEIGARQIIPAKLTTVLDGHFYSTGTYTLKVIFWGKRVKWRSTFKSCSDLKKGVDGFVTATVVSFFLRCSLDV